MMPAPWPPSLVAAVSHGVAAFAFLLLSALVLLLLRRNRGGGRYGGALGGACLLTALWAAGVALQGQGLDAPLGQVLEPLRSGAWLVFLLTLLYTGRRLRVCLAALAVAQALLLLTLPNWPLAVGLAGPGVTAAGSGAALFTGSRLTLAVCGMLLVEMLYRNTAPPNRWGIKFACLAIGALFAYDIYLYSDALLLRRLNEDIWAARGVVDALAAPLLAVAVMRNPAWAPGLALSRQIMFRSAALLGSALYLLTMAASAYYLRSIGGAWGPLMQLACLFGAALLLAGVLFSGSLRASLKVWINKHFYQGRFDYRQEWLRITRALAEEGPALGERTIQAVAELAESPAGALWIRRERGRFEPAASWNMALPRAEETGDSALCRFLAQRQWVIDVAECRAQPQRYAALALPAWLLALPKAWLVVPLMLHGVLFGFVVLDQPRARLALDWEMTDVLKIAGSQAAGYLAHREAADTLAVARQFDSFNRMSTFIVHDLKNLVSQLSLLLANAEKHQANPAFQRDMLATLEHSVGKMTMLLRKLSRGTPQEQAAPLLLDQLLARAVQARADSEPRPVLVAAASGLAVRADGTRLERVIGHLLQNAVEATPRDGSVAVRLTRAGEAAVVELSDTGQGMSEQFIRERLFRPFDSTKPAGMGIGVFESREYIREMGGELEVSSAPGQGTTFRVVLPLLGQAAVAA